MKAVRRGGDGGTVTTINRECPNQRVRMNCGVDRPLRPGRPDVAERVAINTLRAAALVETIDPSDRAHSLRDPSTNMLIPAADKSGRPTRGLQATPRRYHPSQMTSLGVGIDSAYERTNRILAWLQQNGLADKQTTAAARQDYACARLDAAGNLQRVTRRVAKVRLSPAERAIESMASALLRRR